MSCKHLCVTITVALLFLGGCTSTEFSSPPPPTSLQPSTMSPDKQQEVKKLKAQIEHLENEIEQIDNQILAIDHELNRGMMSGFSTTIGNDVQRAYDSELAITHKLTDREFLINKQRNLQEKLAGLRNKMSQLLDEASESCFPPGTLILMPDGTFRPIEKLKAGDRISAYDIGVEAKGEAVIAKVFKNINNHFYIINGHVMATALERFLTAKGWKRIRELKIGDKIMKAYGYETVQTIEKVNYNGAVYNLNVSGAHNFYVSHNGREAYLVHNCGGGGGGGK